MHNSQNTHARNIVIVEHFDPLNLTPGGIDSIIHDLVKYSKNGTFRIVGISGKDGSVDVGKWTKIRFAGRDVEYLPIARFDRFDTAGIRGKIPHSFLFALGLLRYRRLLPVAEYHAHRIETGLLVSFLTSADVVQFIHNDSTGLLSSGSDSVWRRLPLIYRILERNAAKKAAKMVLFNKSDSERLYLQRRDLIVSRTWFDSDVFTGSPNRVASDEKIRICWVGRLDQQKDPILAIYVVDALKQLGKKVRMTMIGDGVLRDAVHDKVAELRLAEEVEIAGALKRAEVASAMRMSDVLLMTSRYEGSPVVLLEAGASGLPVVATQEADPDQALESGLNGERVANRRAADLARAILQAETYSPDTCRKLANTRSGRATVPALLEAVKPQQG